MQVAVYQGVLHWVNCRPYAPVTIDLLEVPEGRAEILVKFYSDADDVADKTGRYEGQVQARRVFLNSPGMEVYETGPLYPYIKHPDAKAWFRFELKELQNENDKRFCFVEAFWKEPDRADVKCMGLLTGYVTTRLPEPSKEPPRDKDPSGW